MSTGGGPRTCGFWRRVLEPRQPQDLPLHRRGARVDALRAERPSNEARRPLPSVFRARQGLRGSREYAESWRYYERGNELKRAESRYRPEVIELNTAKQKAVCTREFFEQRTGFGAASTAPIFVSGCRVRVRR